MTLDDFPRQLSAVIGEMLKAVGVFFNESYIKHTWQPFTLSRIVRFDNQFADALQGNHVAADSDLMVLRADLHSAATEHVARVLWCCKTHQGFFAQGVERDDARATACGGVQLGHHARAVGPGVLTNDENGVGALEVFQRCGAFANSDRFGQRRRGGLMAHVRAVREIGHAIQAAKQLIEKCGFIRRASRGVQLQFPRVAQMVQLFADLGERFVPTDRQVFVTGGVVAHRLSNTALFLQVVIAPCGQFANRMQSEKVWCDTFFGRFPGQCLGTVLTVFKRVRFLRIRPGTAGAIEATRFVHGQQRSVALEQNMLMQQMFVDCTERRPAASGRAVGL
ncbi:hypothetical protein ALP22_05580 [Pseudomonas coronafaciens pv. porri]|nr:hypothetical protein ALP22_05580 [Pseudomonas coronafaciens pv. porri]